MREEWKLVLLAPNKDSLWEGYVTNITQALDGDGRASSLRPHERVSRGWRRGVLSAWQESWWGTALGVYCGVLLAGGPG